MWFAIFLVFTFGVLGLGDWFWHRKNRRAAAAEYADWN
jgi:hypothetical protein